MDVTAPEYDSASDSIICRKKKKKGPMTFLFLGV